jgi:DNA-binding XRE family transcriptional regulator
MVKILEEKLAALSPERRGKVEARTAELVAEEMSLRELRRAMGKTQAKIALELGVGQDSVARYEQRTDMLLSTLSEYVNKVGGKLELTARFPNRSPVRIKGFSEFSSTLAKDRLGARRTSKSSTTIRSPVRRGVQAAQRITRKTKSQRRKAAPLEP